MHYNARKINKILNYFIFSNLTRNNKQKSNKQIKKLNKIIKSQNFKISCNSKKSMS